MVWLQQEPSNSKQTQVWTVWKQLDVVGHGPRTDEAAVDLCGCKTTKAIKLATVFAHQFKYLAIVNLIPQNKQDHSGVDFQVSTFGPKQTEILPISLTAKQLKQSIFPLNM